MSRQISGLKLFLLAADPCSEYKREINKITDDDIEKIKWYISEKIKPDVAFVKHCFKDAVESYIKSCKDNGYEPNFSYGSVLNYWRYHHNHNGDCEEAIVISFVPNSFAVIVSVDQKNYFAFNPYNIDLKNTNKFEEPVSVLVHKKIIFAKL